MITNTKAPTKRPTASPVVRSAARKSSSSSTIAGGLLAGAVLVGGVGYFVYSKPRVQSEAVAELEMEDMFEAPSGSVAL